MNRNHLIPVCCLFGAVLFPALARAAVPACDGGLLGTYYDQNDTQGAYFTGITSQRIDGPIDFDDDGDWANLPGGQDDNFSVRWTGDFETPNNNGNYTFRTNSDDGVRLYLDINQDGDFGDAGELLIDNWTDHGPTLDTSVAINLAGNTRYPVILEFYENGGGALIELEMDQPGGGTNFNLIPAGNLCANLPAPAVVSVAIGSDPTDPLLACGNVEQLLVTFDTVLDDNTAEDDNNYDLGGGNPNINNATLQADGVSVLLDLNNPLTPGANYTLSITDVESDLGVVVNPNPATFGFTAGTPGALTAGLLGTYYDQNGTPGAYFTGNPFERVDAQVFFDVGTGQMHPSVAADYFSVRWEGFVYTANYRNGFNQFDFITYSDDGVRLSVNNQSVIDNWTLHGRVRDVGSIDLNDDTYYPLTLEFFENGGDADIELLWDPPRFFNPEEVIPAANLFHCELTPLTGGFQLGVSTTNASTCAPITVDITALRNNGSVDTNYNDTVQISTSSGHGDWLNLDGGGAFDNGVADDGIAIYTFDNNGGDDDQGTVQLQLVNTHADDVVISVFEVGDGSTLSTSATVAFRDNAFVINENDPLNATSTVVAGRPHQFQVQMINRDSVTGSCGVNPAYTGNIALKAWLNRDGLDPGGAAPDIDGSAALPSATPGANNLTLAFTGGSAAFTLNTTDVGKYGLNFQDDSSGFAKDTSGNPRPIIGGTSTAVTARPFGFHFSGVQLEGGPSGPILAGAGSSFAATLTGVLWDAADDGDDNGVPDGHTDTLAGNDADLSNNGATPAYAADTALQAALPMTPAGGNLGTLNTGTVTVAASLFAGGSATASNLQYSEVGGVTLSAQLTDYLGTADADTISRSPLIGRFTPAYLDVVITRQGCFVPGFTYSGQPVDEVQLTARNAVGATTLNYGPAYSKAITFSDGGATGTGAFSNNTVASGSFTAGTVTLADQPTFTFTNPETLPTLIPLRATDSDAVNSAGHEQSIAVRSGRARLFSTGGSELLPLPMVFRIETWRDLAGTAGWQIETGDTCTVLNTGDVSFSNLNPGGLNIAATAFPLSNGVGSITLTGDQPGSADVTLDVMSWLEFDWNSDATLDDPSARAAFGVYKGNDAQIYIRE